MYNNATVYTSTVPSVVHKNLLGRPQEVCPTILDYTVQAKSKSNYNTPNVWAVYIFNLVLKWVRDQGGVEGECCHDVLVFTFDLIQQ